MVLKSETGMQGVYQVAAELTHLGFIAAVAEAHLGNHTACNQDAKYLIDEAGDNPDYASIKAAVSKILTNQACN
jgi:hypothetical protein